MLVVTAKEGQCVLIGNALVTFNNVEGKKVRMGIDAPRTTIVERYEVLMRDLVAAGFTPGVHGKLVRNGKLYTIREACCDVGKVA